MNLLISSALSFLAQLPASTLPTQPASSIWFEGSGGAGLVDVKDIECRAGRLASHPELKDWLLLDFKPKQIRNTVPAQLFLYLQQSSRLAGKPISSDGDSIKWMATNSVVYDIDLRNVMAIAGENFSAKHYAEDRLQISAPNESSETLNGFFLGLDNGKLSFETDASKLHFSVEQIVDLTFMYEAKSKKNLPAYVYLTDGSIILSSLDSFDEQFLTIQTAWQQSIAVEQSMLSKIVRTDGHSLEFNPPLLSTSIDGNTMRVAGRIFNQGWPQRPQGEVAVKCLYDGLFAIWCGVDDEVASFYQPSPMRFSIELNGEVKVQSDALSVGDLPQLMRVAVKAGDKIKLHSAALFDDPAGAHGNWCQPTFIRLD